MRTLGLATVLFAALGAGAASAQSANYSLRTLISIPPAAANVQPGGAFTSFDIGFFDPVSRNYYIADRSNASVDIISGNTLQVVGQATGFTGQQATTSTSGADGVVAVTSGGFTTLYAGDGNSTLKVFNATNPSAPTLLQSISTGGSFRVDEMAYSPATHQVLAANNADSPAYATLFNAPGGGASASISVTHITVPGAAATDGMEQPVWNPNTGSFFVSVPSFAGDDAGGVVEINTNGAIGSIYRFGSMGIASCGPAGIGLGGSGNLMVGCANRGTQAVLLNPTANGHAGQIVGTFAQISGTDELWYDPTSRDFFLTGANTAGHRVFSVISDATDTFLGSVLLPVADASNPHSIAVDPLTDDVFVPLAGNTAAVGGNTACTAGCVAVFAPIPEPTTFALMLAGLGLTVGWAKRRRA
ncbi:MAG TPA: PEP-CTERM sorting domain-containing protein [Caldimonas sp.]|nr:PEP-CTERM sorting domain-containing protein [Caldimonas sp.]